MPSKKWMFVLQSLPTASGWVFNVSVMVFMSVSPLRRLRLACAGLSPLLNHTLPRCLCDLSCFAFTHVAVLVHGWPFNQCCQRLVNSARILSCPFLCIATPPKCLKLLKFLLQDRGPLGLGNNANGWRFLWPPLPLRLRHCCRLQSCWSKGKGEATKNGATRYTDMPVGRCN